MDDDWQRCFIALTPDATAREALVAVPIDKAMRRVPVDQFHLTLAFLGSIPAAKGIALSDALPAVIRPLLPALQIERIEHWPSAAHPRLVVAALVASDELLAIEASVRALLHTLALPIDDHRPFHPHVTLARHSCNAMPAHEVWANMPARGLRFDTLALFSSTVARSCARYRALASVPLR